MLHLSPAITAYLVTLFTVLGLVMGSFLNAWAWRLCHGESVAKGRSHCAHCGHTLAARDLVPLVSFLVLRGRCRYCGGKISRRYPAVEAVCAALFVSLLLRFDLVQPLLTIRWLGLGCILLVLSLVDWDTQQLPDGLLLAAGLLALFRIPLEGVAGVKSAALGAVCISMPLLLLVLAADKVLGKETMGGGDIKLFFVLGLHFCPGQTLLILILACFFGILLAVITGRLHGKSIAFGPAIAAASWVTAIFGSPMIQWYLSLFK